LFDKLKAEQDDWRSNQPREEITITLPDGKTKPGKSWETSPMDIAKDISKSLSERIIISKVSLKSTGNETGKRGGRNCRSRR